VDSTTKNNEESTNKPGTVSDYLERLLKEKENSFGGTTSSAIRKSRRTAKKK